MQEPLLTPESSSINSNSDEKGHQNDLVPRRKKLKPTVHLDKPASGALRECFKFLTGVTLVGLIYLDAKTITVRSGNVAVTYDSGKLKIYGEGRHLLFSPFHRFSHMMSLRQRVFELPSVEFISADQIPMRIVAVLTCQVMDPKKCIISVKDVKKAVIEQAETTLAGIFRSHTFKEMCPNIRDSTAQFQGRVKDEHHDQVAFDNESAQKLVGQLQRQFMEEFSEMLSNWGVWLISLRILTIVPTHNSFSRAAEEGLSRSITARATNNRLRIENETKVLAQQNDNYVKMLDAQARQHRVIVKTEAEAKRQLIIAEAQSDALKLKQTAELEAQKLQSQYIRSMIKVAEKSPEHEKIVKTYLRQKFFKAAGNTQLIAGFDMKRSGLAGDELMVNKK